MTTAAVRTMCEAFQQTAAVRPDAVALRAAGGGVTVTWAQYAARVRELAGGLAALGVGPGTPVAILLRNRPEFHLVDTAAMHLGAVPFSIFATSSPAQVDHLLQVSGARVVVCEQMFATLVVPAAARSGAVMVSVDGPLPDAAAIPLGELPARAEAGFDFDAHWRAVAPDDVLTLIYTSGTTGEPKGVEITHRAELAQCAATNSAFGVRAGDRFLSFLPSAHIADRWSTHYTQLTAGTEVTTLDDPRALAAALVETRPDLFGAVPQIWHRLHRGLQAVLQALAASDPDTGARIEQALAVGRRYAAALGQGPVDPSLQQAWEAVDAGVFAPLRARLGLDRARVAISGAAPIPAGLLTDLRALGLPVSSVFGMSEISGIVAYSAPADAPAASVGRPIAGVEVALAPDGELLVRGETLMRGYRDDPARTAAAIDTAGWLHTGDIATLSADGAITVVGRSKELMVSSGGKNLAPAAIEGALLAAGPLLAYALVVGDARPYVTALLVPDAEALAAFTAASGIDTDPADVAAVVAHPLVQEAIAAGVERANLTLSRPESVRRHVVVPEYWTPGDDVVTHTRKLRRRPVEVRYAAQIEALYPVATAAAST